MAEVEEDELADNSVGACNDSSGVKLESEWSQIGVKRESEYESESGERSPSPLPAPVKPEAFEEDFYPVNPGELNTEIDYLWPVWLLFLSCFPFVNNLAVHSLNMLLHSSLPIGRI